MKKKIILIAWYFPSFPGGAEKSILEELILLNKKNDVSVICFDEKFKKGKFEIKGIKGHNYGLKNNFSNISRFLTIQLNKKYVKRKLEKEIKEKKYEEIILQGLMSPYINSIIPEKIKKIYYIRDEINFNIFNNYEQGLKKIAKELKNIVEKKAIKEYKKLNEKLLKESEVIVNSKYMQKKLFEKFKIKSKIEHPKIKPIKLKKRNPEYITFIGGHNSMKGYDIVLKISKKLPEEKFLIIGNYKRKRTKKNITYLPWQKNIEKIYSKTKILLVPSRWNEAFGRVVIEANNVGIPTLTSNRGGLPEANKNKKNIINDLENIDKWVGRIKEIERIK